ncbi:phasin family protein [Rickettsiales endosymbiont of Stachyamoeba lipophora]|uniref:phasin family protein n=1 Tax=Rickettsiales endosymbiont of Stachyamoeba lipophora TaxID=2486578 RepID=UPI000F64C8AC|nr:phasin family protein [Rickettsiales endosymbiont of Stachyamoeba lipophora]AZL16037.1 hypothetical protein EF513_05745 [Rickettsiales endosymbiont of Stachyamoeba lipophora]
MSANPYMDMFNNMMNVMPMMNNFMNMCKMPNMDTNNNMMNMKKVMDSCYQTNQTIASCMQAIMRTQSEIMQNNMSQAFDMAKDCTNINGENLVQKQAKSCQNMFDNAVSSTKEMAQTMNKACMEMFEVMTKNAAECMNDNMGQFGINANNKKKSA